jgi:hypothetical protein
VVKIFTLSNRPVRAFVPAADYDKDTVFSSAARPGRNEDDEVNPSFHGRPLEKPVQRPKRDGLFKDALNSQEFLGKI